MSRRKFLSIAGITIAAAGAATYLLSDNKNYERADINDESSDKISFQHNEKEILYLASLAPSGHNTQPWIVKYVEPYHWIIGNDKKKWLPAVDPSQRETILSIGAFIQNLEYAANSAGYLCKFNLLAANNQDEDIMEVHLQKTSGLIKYDTGKLIKRRTVRSGYLTDPLKKEDASYILEGEKDFSHFIPGGTKEYYWLNENTIEANRIQVSQSAGWLVITSSENSVETLLETGKRFQRIFLKIRDRKIAIHQITQILEEPETKQMINASTGINNSIQFILRLGYLKNYPEPVTLRRPVNWFVSK